jgi:hypothetical protein
MAPLPTSLYWHRFQQVESKKGKKNHTVAVIII